MCLTEHHLNKTEMNYENIDSYNLGACFCRKSRKNGGVIIFVLETPQYTSIDLNETCIELDIEICGVKLHYSSSNICVLSNYRSPSGNFLYFLNTLESILNKIYTNSLNMIMCRDININYFDDDDTNRNKIPY